MRNNYYKVLCLNQKASDQEIRQAYKKLALKYHPDKNNNVGTEEKFKLILEAHNVLIDPAERTKFDNQLKDCRNQCSKCSAIFEKSDDFDKHCEKHHPKQFKCNYCASIAYFETSVELIKHVSKLHQFNCDMCPTSFVVIKDLSLHKKQFHPVPIECSSCKSTFTQLEELTKHAKLCSQFKCNLCLFKTSKFRSIEDLALHKKQFHPIYMPFHCTCCYSSFASYNDLAEHCEKHHPKQFKCNYCASIAYFETSVELIKHVSFYHQFNCVLCSTSFGNIQDLCQHKLNFHSPPTSSGKRIVSKSLGWLLRLCITMQPRPLHLSTTNLFFEISQQK